MTLPVVAGNALQVQAEKILGGADGHLVVRVRLVDVDVVEIVNVIAQQEIGGAIDEIVARAGREQFPDDFIVRPVQQQRIVDVVAQQIAPPGTQFSCAVAEQVAEKVGPLVQKRRFRLVDLALNRRGHERVDRLLALGGTLVRQELADRFRLWQAPCQIQVNAAQKLGVSAQTRVRNTIALHLGEDELVDEIADRRRLAGSARCFGRNLLREPVQTVARWSRLFRMLGRNFRPLHGNQ